MTTSPEFDLTPEAEVKLEVPALPEPGLVGGEYSKLKPEPIPVRR